MILPFALALMVAVESTDHAVPAIVESVYDGDTIRVRAQVWPGWQWNGSVRVEGIDTPELRGKCPQERELAQRAKALVEEYITPTVMLINPQHGKYARRVVAEVYTAEGISLGALLIAAGLAHEYHGGTKIDWCRIQIPEPGLREDTGRG